MCVYKYVSVCTIVIVSVLVGSADNVSLTLRHRLQCVFKTDYEVRPDLLRII